jgi:tocopherol cyclase
MLSGCPDPFNALIWDRPSAINARSEPDHGPWFEWWYYKLIMPETGDAFYFIYGVVNPWDGDMEVSSSQAYVIVGNFGDKDSVTEVYPVSDFQASYTATDVRLPGGHATDKAMSGMLTDSDGEEVSWDIQIEKKWAFNAMGWAMSVPNVTNIGWYPAQADARFTGSIEYKGKTYTFDDVPGYQDRNWGTSFPEWWTWITANHFQGHPDSALAVGGGKPIILNLTDRIEGVSIGLMHEGKEYAFRPSHGDLVRVNIRFGTWEIEAINRVGDRIVIVADAPCEDFMDLEFQSPLGPRFHDFETLGGEVSVDLYEATGSLSRPWRFVDSIHSDMAGIEYGHHEITSADCLDDENKELFSNF